MAAVSTHSTNQWEAHTSEEVPEVLREGRAIGWDRAGGISCIWDFLSSLRLPTGASSQTGGGPLSTSHWQGGEKMPSEQWELIRHKLH